ncbi:hypothetical protein OK006_10928 [Actinobacteria bacterium OK006]|nr:hypothetical protein OK006_10928 [Actinobacteria bacterium OK006]
MSMKKVATSAGGAAPGSAIEQLLFTENWHDGVHGRSMNALARVAGYLSQQS